MRVGFSSNGAFILFSMAWYVHVAVGLLWHGYFVPPTVLALWAPVVASVLRESFEKQWELFGFIPQTVLALWDPGVASVLTVRSVKQWESFSCFSNSACSLGSWRCRRSERVFC